MYTFLHTRSIHTRTDLHSHKVCQTIKVEPPHHSYNRRSTHGAFHTTHSLILLILQNINTPATRFRIKLLHIEECGQYAGANKHTQITYILYYISISSCSLYFVQMLLLPFSTRYHLTTGDVSWNSLGTKLSTMR